MSKVSITLEGNTLEEAITALRGNGAAILVESGTTDELIMTLRDRLASEDPPRVLRILPFAEEAKAFAITETGQPAPMPEAKKRGRPPKAAAAPAPAPVQTDLETGIADAGEDENAPPQCSIDDVRAALDKLKALQGIVTVRQLMEKVTGSSKLVDIPETKFAELIAALNREANDATANQAKNAKQPTSGLKNSKEAQELSQEAA